jgi:hypothetical protein
MLKEVKARLDEKEKKKAEQGPAWWYEPVRTKVSTFLNYFFSIVFYFFFFSGGGMKSGKCPGKTKE